MHDDAAVDVLVQAALALGIASLRAPLLALRVAHACAALDGRMEVERDDLVVAARLVLGPRATQLPADTPPDEPESPEDETPPEPPSDDNDDGTPPPLTDEQLQNLVLDAARASIPPHLLAQLAGGALGRSAATGGGRGAAARSQRRGRPVGTRSGELRDGQRLNLIETLRASAPWQPLRRRARGPGMTARVEVRREDFRIQRFKQRMQNTAVFVVDASGSAALHRLAETKGAVELFLADCYVRRDQVALIAFRGQCAELLLSPTRSLARARRSLAGLPGGGATPLASALKATLELADAIRRRGDRPLVILLTDGRANVALDGSQGRPQAEADAQQMAQAVRMAGVRVLLIDTSPRASPQAAQLAATMGARYLPLPHADAHTMSSAVRAASAATG